LQRVQKNPARLPAVDAAEPDARCTHASQGPGNFSQSAGVLTIPKVQKFNDQLERVAEVAVVLVVGAMLSYTFLHPGAFWFVPLLLLVIRPVSVWVGLLGGAPVSRDQRVLISWFGIRGIGSIYYLMFAINHGLPRAVADELIAITLAVVAVSIVLHGISVTPLMDLYARRMARRGAAGSAKSGDRGEGE
jgi:sodium/hydrogen antiporter